MPSAPISAGEGLTALAALVGLAALVSLSEGLRRWGVAAGTTRRLVHVGVSLFVASTPLLFTRPLPVYGLAGLFTLLNAGARSRQWWRGIHSARPESWGTVALPLSVLPALAATWSISPDRILTLQTAYLVLALADPAASWIGEWAQPRPKRQTSTVAGSLTFAGITLVVTTTMLAGLSVTLVLGAAIGTTLVATTAEAVSHRGWDNLFVVAAVLLVLVPIQEQALPLTILGVALSVGAGFGGLAYITNALDKQGAATGGLFAASLVGLGGWPWIVPGIAFFGLSSALTGLGHASRSESTRRTQAQVLANGGIAWTALAIVAVAPAEMPHVMDYGYAAFVGALAAAAADTWATELGRWSPWPPWSLRDGRRVPTGTSGAVSVIGTGAAVLGAASVVGAALLVEGPLTGPAGRNAALLVGAGMVGMWADSAAGAFLQAQYRVAASGSVVETPPSRAAKTVRGWAGIGNNAVNVIGTTAGALAALGGVLLLGS